MIGRLWQARAENSAKADAYEEVFRGAVLAELRDLRGFRGAYLLRRDTGFLTMTLFDGLDDVRGFTGRDVETANVSGAARAVLADFDTTARHFRVVVDPSFSDGH
ncbi:hypothetical protein [Amycolatopsis sp. CA-230715]|uniref:hypothetical protein n=1 Tax=Amycolatopsis sp. CA-230715 TaxID=2745196 RepID=UPI001C035374|nr:hypothetical protein [Amycolatopsis sp. CA-230715]QWF81218.1 hypothetical protein HUW46_04644 [Amycolatopsis sp. CA-230715]